MRKAVRPGCCRMLRAWDDMAFGHPGRCPGPHALRTRPLCERTSAEAALLNGPPPLAAVAA